MSLILFVVGLIVLFKGSFRLGARVIAFAQSRNIALLLMAPFILAVCASFTVGITNPNVFLSMLSEDGTLNPDSTALNSLINMLGTFEFILVIGSLVLVAVIIYNTPQTGGVPRSSPAQAPAAPNPSAQILTVAEAAAYMRVSEKEVLELIEQGKLGAARIGSTYRIARIAIDDFMGLAK